MTSAADSCQRSLTEPADVGAQCASLLLDELAKLQGDKEQLEARAESLAATAAQARQQCKKEEERAAVLGSLRADAEETADRSRESAHAAAGERAAALRRANE